MDFEFEFDLAPRQRAVRPQCDALVAAAPLAAPDDGPSVYGKPRERNKRQHEAVCDKMREAKAKKRLATKLSMANSLLDSEQATRK